MLDLSAELRRIVEGLDRAGVPYAVAGGVAVSIYTRPRATEDIDLLLGPGDLERAIDVLTVLGFETAGQPMRVAGGALEIQRLIKIEAADLLPLDLLLPRDPSLRPLLADRAEVSWEGGTLSIVGLPALRTLKRLRGSAQDRADLEALGPEAT